MTYLDLVNQVLIRLREPEVDGISVGVMGPLIAAFVSDAYKIVEDAHDWSVLRSQETVDTVPSQPTVTLSGVPVDSMVYSAYIQGTDFLHKVSKEWMIRRDSLGNTSNTQPTRYRIASASQTTGDLEVELFPVPDAVYPISFNVAKRGTAPVDNADRVILPIEPIRALALAMATRERGETGGTSAAEYFQIADLTLGQAIARDANFRPDEITLYTP